LEEGEEAEPELHCSNDWARPAAVELEPAELPRLGLTRPVWLLQGSARRALPEWARLALQSPAGAALRLDCLAPREATREPRAKESKGCVRSVPSAEGSERRRWRWERKRGQTAFESSEEAAPSALSQELRPA
jgi:hypothetical protein